MQQSPQLVPLIPGTAKPSPGELWGLPGRTQGWQQWLRPQDRPPAGAGLAHRPWREKTPTSSEHSGISFPLYARKMPSCRCWLQTCGRTAQPSPSAGRAHGLCSPRPALQGKPQIPLREPLLPSHPCPGSHQTLPGAVRARRGRNSPQEKLQESQSPAVTSAVTRAGPGGLGCPSGPLQSPDRTQTRDRVSGLLFSSLLGQILWKAGSKSECFHLGLQILNLCSLERLQIKHSDKTSALVLSLVQPQQSRSSLYLNVSRCIVRFFSRRYPTKFTCKV